MARKLTTEEFIERAKRKHGDSYDYSKVEYVGSHKLVTIICPIHGDFPQSPSNHLAGKGCRDCGGSKHIPFEEFQEKALKLHNNFYSYYAEFYENQTIKTKIYCPKHGDFPQEPYVHLKPSDCPKCANEKRVEDSLELRAEEFQVRLFDKFGDKIICDKSSYKKSRANANFYCEVHGEFVDWPTNVINSKYGCNECYKDQQRSATSYFESDLQFLKWVENEQANSGDLVGYEFELLSRDDETAELKAYCGVEAHNSFSFILERGGKKKLLQCVACIVEKRNSAVKETYQLKRTDYFSQWIDDVNSVHGDIFDLSQVVYTNQRDEILVGCQIHGFFPTTPDRLLNGGCRKCADENLKGLYSETYFKKHPEQKTVPAEIYYLKLVINGFIFYKVGITTSSTKTRHSMLNSCPQLKWEIKLSSQSNLYDAWKLEQNIQKQHGNYFRCDIPLDKDEIRRIRLGPSECFQVKLPTIYLDQITSS